MSKMERMNRCQCLFNTACVPPVHCDEEVLNVKVMELEPFQSAQDMFGVFGHILEGNIEEVAVRD